ncbi:hypothetical protein JTB14_002613 [Gonioctena quinquepunctata]|nr:hypothetical protein JTB14_002613 [Gonioctena quinquepunctata]
MSSRKRKPFTQIEVDDENSTARKKSRAVEDDITNCQRRAGTIKYMTLKNFMCHSLLEVNFTNNISIIIGKNGSGKSAILTALIVGLGGKASLTNRGTTVKGFVKAGKPSGSIEIELCNEGPMSYRPTVYGKSINIIRNLNSSGGGTYRIRSENGEVISTQAREVQNITSSLNIQVDNPICILNQDTSRNFLSSNDPKNKFTLFMKATKLETLDSEYKKVHGNKRESTRIMEEKEENFKKLQDEIKRLKRKIDNHKSIISLKDKKVLLQRELLWAKVRDVEEELEGEKSRVDSVESKLDEFKANSSKRGDRISTLKEHIKDLEQQILEVKEQIEEYWSQKKRKATNSDSIESKNSDIKSLKEDITASNENMSKIEQQKMERIKKLASLQNKLKGMDDHLETAKNDLFQIKSDLSRKEDDEKNLKIEISNLDQQIANEKNNLKAIQSESGNELLLYGRDMPRIKQMIVQYRNKFDKEPRGPLGTYIKLKDKKWAIAVEGYIGAGTLCAFTVDNNKDNKLLREIFSRVSSGGRQPQVITSKFLPKKHDTPEIYCSPENILLIPTDRKAQELLSDKQHVPRNCHQGITAKGDKYYPDPNYRTYASNYVRAKYLQVDTKEYIQQLQQTIDNLYKKKQVITTQLEQFMNDVQQQVVRKNELEEKVRRVNCARTQIRKQLEELNSTAEPEVQNVQYLEQELEEVRKVLTEKNADLERVNEEIREIKATIVGKEQNLSQLKGSTKGLEERIQSFKDEVQENQTKLKEISTSEEFDKRRVREYESKLNEARAQMVLKQNVVKKLTSEASSVGERLQDLRQVPNITNEIKEIQHRIARIETDAEDVTEVMERHNELSEKFMKSADLMKALQADKILEYRQFKGTIEIKMAEKKLDLVVIPQHGSQGLTTTSNLSGGERSFSTVAFLYSLWQCMEFPFYFLDEFDVYMDKLNHFIYNKDVSILRLEDPERFNI